MGFVDPLGSTIKTDDCPKTNFVEQIESVQISILLNLYWILQIKIYFYSDNLTLAIQIEF